VVAKFLPTKSLREMVDSARRKKNGNEAMLQLFSSATEKTKDLDVAVTEPT